jgi:glycosyltransferase involved in cell wall biosynthesis
LLKASLVFTVKNEASTLPALLDSVLGQVRKPDEVVVCDGGSADGTLRVLDEYKGRISNLKVLRAPGANIARGRNLAIAAASSPIIVCTDAGVRLDPHWLALLTSPFEYPGAPDVVSGFFLPDASNPFEIAMGATVLPDLSDVDPERFLPSSRSVAFRKSAWEAVGGYPEWLDYCEDLVFDMALRAAGFRFLFEPRAIAYYRPRSSMKAYFVQYYRYARGDGKANLWWRRHAIRYATYFGLIPALGWSVRRNWLALLVGIALSLVYLRRPLERAWVQSRGLDTWDRFGVLGLVPFIRLVGDVAKMVGYPAGLLWRVRSQRKF